MISSNHQNQRRHLQKDRSDAACRVFLGNIDPTWTRKEIETLMAKHGTVANVIIRKIAKMSSKAYAFVTFESPTSAIQSLGQLSFKDRIVEVRPAINVQPTVADTHAKVADRVGPKKQKGSLGIKKKKHGADPLANSPKTPMKLSKNSKQFITSDASTDLEAKRSGDTSVEITVNVIKVGNGVRPPGQDSEDQKGARKGSLQLEKVKVISKHSKEFYPTSDLSMFRPDFEASMSEPVLDCKTMQDTFRALVGDGRKGQHFQANIASQNPGQVEAKPSGIHISFFTFPGRV